MCFTNTHNYNCGSALYEKMREQKQTDKDNKNVKTFLNLTWKKQYMKYFVCHVQKLTQTSRAGIGVQLLK